MSAGFPTPKCGECGKPSMRWVKNNVERYICPTQACGTLLLGVDLVARFDRIREMMATGWPTLAPEAPEAVAVDDDGPHDEKDAITRR